MKRNAPTKISRLMFLAVFLCGALPVFAQAPPLRSNGKIAFTSDRDGNREVYVMNADGTNQVRLTNNLVVDDHPTWSPDGTKIAFVSERTTGGRAIFTMNPDGTGRTEVTPVSYVDRYTQWPYWIWTDFYSMDWSPDSTQIVFQDNYDIVIVNAAGSNRHAITDGTSYDLEPAWSPDGSKIVFSRDPINDGGLQYGRLSTMNTDGSNIQFLPNGWQYQAYAPKWAPSGDKVLYVIEYTDFDPTSVITISNADGSAPQLFDGRTDIYEYQYRNKPSWSPDGMKILFDKLVYETGYPGDLEIYVKNIDGTGFTQLTNTNGWNFNPSWQPIAPDSSPNPIDRGDVFIRQQYLDFLEREPEPAGLQFYLDILNGCHPADTECVKYTRGALSANFFRSPEFGRKGAYIANLFNIVMGQRPKTVAELNDPTKVERPHYAEFMADLATLSTPNDDPVLTDQKKDQLASAWLARTEVQSILPGGLSNQQFVQKLESIAGVTLANESTLIANLNNGSQTRAQVLRAIAESNEVVTKFYIPNFVTMEYLGYLRRDPEDCHVSSDPESCGFIFHNRRFNTPGADPDLIENIIVRGFIESPEYRSRFFGSWDY